MKTKWKINDVEAPPGCIMEMDKHGQVWWVKPRNTDKKKEIITEVCKKCKTILYGEIIHRQKVINRKREIHSNDFEVIPDKKNKERECKYFNAGGEYQEKEKKPWWKKVLEWEIPL